MPNEFHQELKQNKEKGVKGLWNHFSFTQINLKSNIAEHSASVYSICITGDDRLASCSEDRTIRIFNLIDYKCDLVIRGFDKTNKVVSFQGKLLLAFSSDSTIKIFEIYKEDYKCLQTIFAHSFGVLNGIEMTNNRICSCSHGEIKIWNGLSPYQLIYSIEEKDSDDFYSLLELKSHKHFVSASRDWSIRFWNNFTYKCEKILRNIICYNINCLTEAENEKLLIGGYYGIITIINSSTFQLETKIKLGQIKIGAIHSVLHLPGEAVLCGDSKGNLVQININTYKMSYLKKKAHSDKVRDVIFFKGKTLISCSDDTNIKIWSD